MLIVAAPAFKPGEFPTAVNAAYRTALDQGGTGDGAPGLRPEYDAHYYAAFVRDPDGNKIEILTFAAG